MQFIEVNGVYWSRWEVRVMDVARFVTDNAPLSRDSLAFWGNSDFPLGPTAPMVGITRRDAKDFCVWLARKVSDSAPEPLYRQLHRKATPEGRLPTREDWEGLTLHEKLNAPFAYAIYPEAREWYTEHFRSEYADRDLDFLPFLQPVDQRALSPSGFFGLQDGVWEWSGSYYFYDGRRSTNAERQKWLLAGGGFTGKVAFNAIAPPDPDLAFVLRKETIGFRPVIDPRGK
jgi:formylglycine-generating enzyme required for sulfatase activity